MSKRIDLTGQKFSHLTVLKLDEEKTKNSGRTHWIVECDCEDHTTFSVSSSNLKSGNSTKCKYCKAENLLGQRFERLTVTKRIIDDKDHVMWEATCDCGNKIIVRGDSLRTGHTRSCGCLQKEVVGSINKKDLVGQKFGRLTVIKQSQRKDSSGNYYWFCNCECGTTNQEVSGHHLVQGNISSCGCMRSKGEEKITKILIENNIKFKREYLIEEFTLSTGGHPRFDFAILDDNNQLKYFIEYHGEQHYQARGSIFTEERVAVIQIRDKEKEKFCEENAIPLIIIPYTKFNDLNIKDLIILEEKNES